MLGCYYALALSGNKKALVMSTKRKRAAAPKEPIRVRFKPLANGNKSIYLDSYKNGVRAYEFLKLHLIPEKTPAAKLQNRETLQAATAIKAQRIIDLNNAAHGLQNNRKKSNANFIEYCKHRAEVKKQKAAGSERGTFLIYKTLIYHLDQFAGNKTTFKQIDKTFCTNFISYLKQARSQRNNEPLNPNTILSYIKTLEAILNAAIDDEIIIHNPLKKIKDKPTKQETHINFLTADEVKKLEQTDCTKPQVKNAFLFCCYTGLRFSDVKAITWEKLQHINGRWLYVYRQQKTDKPQYTQVSDKAATYLPPRPHTAADTDFVFDIPNNGYTNIFLSLWAAKAGINKKVTFHVARHTNATLLLSKGVPIETISKQLGHSSIQVTQIYAEVLDESLMKAVDTLNHL